MTMLPIKHKVFAYITHGDRLLVFSHPFAPEAGIQVPAGTVNAGEPFEEAVMREAEEETGLRNLTLVGWLGEQDIDLTAFGKAELHRHHFYHLRCADAPPDTWRHYERYPSEGPTEPIAFDFFWARLPDDVPELIADHGKYLTELMQSLALEAGHKGDTHVE